MYQPETYWAALLFMILSMLCWGSWASSMKMAPKFPFQLFYWDYVVGALATSLFWGFTLGSARGGELAFLNNIHQADTLTSHGPGRWRPFQCREPSAGNGHRSCRVGSRFSRGYRAGASGGCVVEFPDLSKRESRFCSSAA